MMEHRIGTQEEWQAERDELLKEEKELTRRGDELARKRRELPWVPVEKDYRFETEDGTKTLADLFDGRSQLLVYHFMFGPSYEAGCPVCSSIADTLAPQVPHLKARDTTLLLASRAPLAKLIAYRLADGVTERRGGARSPSAALFLPGMRAMRDLFSGTDAGDGRPHERSPKEAP